MEVSIHEEIEGKRSSTCSSTHSSPEFEFWFTRNPSSFPEPDQISTADKLFVDGFLLPLQCVDASQSQIQPHVVVEPSTPSPSLSSDFSTDTVEASPASILNVSARSVPSSQRWKDILFKKPKASGGDGNLVEKKVGKKTRIREKKGGTVATSAELNINIWPFSRSRSAGTDSGRPKLPHPGSTRKVSSAPCSRSNSSGESKSKMWPKSPTRAAQAGVHLGRSSPVWQARRAGNNTCEASPSNSCKKKVTAGSTTVADTDHRVSSGGKIKSRKPLTPRAKILNLTVPMCIGYRPHLSCRAGEHYIPLNDPPHGCDPPDSSAGNFGGNILNLRTLFGKKVY